MNEDKTVENNQFGGSFKGAVRAVRTDLGTLRGRTPGGPGILEVRRIQGEIRAGCQIDQSILPERHPGSSFARGKLALASYSSGKEGEAAVSQMFEFRTLRYRGAEGYGAPHSGFEEISLKFRDNLLTPAHPEFKIVRKIGLSVAVGGRLDRCRAMGGQPSNLNPALWP